MQQFLDFILLMRPNFAKKKLALKYLYDYSLIQKHTVEYVFKPQKEMQKCTLFIIVRMQMKFSQVKPDKYFQYLAGPSPDNSFELSRINYNRQQTFNVLQMGWLKTPASKNYIMKSVLLICQSLISVIFFHWQIKGQIRKTPDTYCLKYFP